MRREHWKLVAVVILLAVMLSAAVYARTGKERARRSSPAEVERKVTKAQVPAAALATLKRLAAGAKITEFAEEIEHGHTFYEGSWKARSGAKMDVLVTKTGDLVEIEKRVGARQVPAAVRKAARKAAGKGTELAYEKKTMILYEVKFQKGNSRHELLVTPDGRHVEHEVERVKRDEDDDEDDDEDEDDDDEEVSIGKVSKAVKITILKHAADGEIEEIECEDEGGRAVYEVGVIIGGKEVELKVDAHGKLVSKDIEDDDDECDDDEDDDDECDDDEDDDDECDDDEDDDDECDDDEDDDDECDDDEDDDDECDDDEDDDDECDDDEDDE